MYENALLALQSGQMIPLYELVKQIGISPNSSNVYKDYLWTIFRSQAVHQTIKDQI